MSKLYCTFTLGVTDVNQLYCMFTLELIRIN